MDTLGERLLAARSRKQAAHEVTLEVYEKELFAIYRPLDFRDVRKIGQQHERLRDEIEKELRVAADTLVAACIKTEAHIDGEVRELPPLGLKLCEEIGLEGPENDRQAVLAIFPTEMAMIQQYIALEAATEAANGQIDDEALGESEEAS